MTELYWLERDIAESIIHNKLRNMSNGELLQILDMFAESEDRWYRIIDKLPEEGNCIKRLTDF